MTSSIITSDRYVAIRFNDDSIAYNRTLRVLTSDGRIIPAKWNDANGRLEACGLNSNYGAVPMYTKTSKLDARLHDLRLNFVWLTLDQAKELAS